VVQVWDLRKFKAPVHVWEDLPAMHPTTQVVYSPDERLILTGVSAGRDGTGGALVFFDAQSRSMVRRIGMPSSVVAVQWHAKLNQIFAGVGMYLLLLKYHGDSYVYPRVVYAALFGVLRMSSELGPMLAGTNSRVPGEVI